VRGTRIVRLSLVLGVAAVACAGPGADGSTGNARVVRARIGRVVVGPPGAPFNMPTDATVGPEGRLYVLDGVNDRVVAYDPEGRFQFQFGTHGAGLGQFTYPLGIATDPNGTIYVADSGNHRFQVFTADGKPLEAVPLPAAASGVAPDPTDVAVDAARKRLYVTDNDNHVVHLYSLADRRFEAVWGGPGQGERQFRFPFLIDISPEGYLFVVEPINTRVQILNPEGKFVAFIGAWGIRSGQLFRPKGVAVHGDRVYITDSYLGNVQVFALDGRFLGVLADRAGTPMSFTTPTGIALDTGRHRLYVVELKAHRVCRVDLE
jgi:DNA-binding beta-propeller fold protein YncE